VPPTFEATEVPVASPTRRPSKAPIVLSKKPTNSPL
jgi:hypothetical protein